MGSSVLVALNVINNSPYPIRFPEPGVEGAEVSVGVIRESPSSSTTMTFYPARELSHFRSAPLTHTWDVAPGIPSVVLKPGERFDQKFFFEHAYSFDQPGKYKAMISTVLQVLVGEKSGPLRRSARSGSPFRLRSSW